MTAARSPVAPRKLRGAVRGRRSATALPKRGGGMRAVMALGVILGAAGLFGGLGVVAWRALPVLPGVDGIRHASAVAAATTPVRTARAAPAVDTIAMTAGAPRAAVVPAAAAAAAPAQPTNRPRRYKLVVIESADTIDVRSRKLQLAFVDAPQGDARCTNAVGKPWPCGARARTALRRLVRAREIDCLDRPGAGPGAAGSAAAPAATSAAQSAATNLVDAVADLTVLDVATCDVGGTDMGRWLVEQGWATPTPDAPREFAELNDEARQKSIGLYNPTAR